jgi:hypothetical protein
VLWPLVHHIPVFSVVKFVVLTGKLGGLWNNSLAQTIENLEIRKETFFRK